MRYALSLLLFSSFLTAQAQQTSNPVQRALRNATIVQTGPKLTLQEVIETALAKNYQIKIARSQEQIARINNTRGAAGFLPVVNLNFQYNLLLQNLRQDFFGTTPDQRLYGVFNRNGTFGPTASWTVFNGLGMYIRLEQQQEQVRINEVNTRANIELTVANVTTAYYDVIRQLQRLLALRQALDISRDRLELARANYEVGTRSKVDFLSAEVDYNADSAALVAQEQALRVSKIGLNTQLVRDPQTDFAIRDTILVRTDLQVDQLRESLTRNNPQLVIAAFNRRVTALNTRLLRAQQFPQVDLLGSYAFLPTNNQAGFGTRQGRNETFALGVRVTMPLYNGLNQKRLIAGARVNEQIAADQESDQRLQLQSSLEQTFTQYRNSLTLLNLEGQNYKIALQNIDIAYERYRVGNSTAVEFRDVQRNAVAAQARLIDAEFNAKSAEIELLRLTSTIVQEVR